MDELYDVVRAQDGALVVRDVDLDTARDEKARLNAEARVKPAGSAAPYTGMYCGELVRYEVWTKDGLAL